MQQAKVFRKIENNKYIFKLTEYPETKSYSELIKFEKNTSYFIAFLHDIVCFLFNRTIYGGQFVSKQSESKKDLQFPVNPFTN